MILAEIGKQSWGARLNDPGIQHIFGICHGVLYLEMVRLYGQLVFYSEFNVRLQQRK